MAEWRLPHVVLLPSPGAGHVIPFIALATRLVHCHGFTATILLLPGGTASLPTTETRLLLDTLPTGVTAVHLNSSPDSECQYPGDFPADTDILEARLTLSVVRCLPSIRTALPSAPASPRALVVDMFGVDALTVAKEAGVPCYVFLTVSAMTWISGQARLNTENQPSESIPEEPVTPPGCVPLRFEDRPWPRHMAEAALSWGRRNWKGCGEADGLLLNTFEAIEPGEVRYLLNETQHGPGRPRVFPVGPLTRDKYPASDPSHDCHPCLQWLSTQPTQSVLFVNFGSGGTLSAEQLRELAAGLEESEQRFLWVVRTPTSEGEDSNAAFLGDRASDKNPLDCLPEGFLDRTRGTGMVLPSWAPQLAILEHAATGGFLTHCGWNSILEAVKRAVPMIAWPLYAEQSLNAALLVRGAKIAIRPQEAGELIGRKEIARVVKALMVGKEGEVVRMRVKALQEAADKAVREGGSSTVALAELAKKWNVSKACTPRFNRQAQKI